MSDLIKDARKELKITLEDKEKNMVRLRFDLYHSTLVWAGVKDKFGKLDAEAIQIKKDLDLINQQGGNSYKSKEKSVTLTKRMEEIGVEIRPMAQLKNDMDRITDIIPKAEAVINSLKDCIDNPQKIYE